MEDVTLYYKMEKALDRVDALDALDVLSRARNALDASTAVCFDPIKRTVGHDKFTPLARATKSLEGHCDCCSSEVNVGAVKYVGSKLFSKVRFLGLLAASCMLIAHFVCVIERPRIAFWTFIPAFDWFTSFLAEDACPVIKISQQTIWVIKVSKRIAQSSSGLLAQFPRFTFWLIIDSQNSRELHLPSLVLSSIDSLLFLAVDVCLHLFGHSGAIKVSLLMYARLVFSERCEFPETCTYVQAIWIFLQNTDRLHGSLRTLAK